MMNGNIDIEEELVKATLKGILFVIVVLIYQIINLKKVGISIFDKQAFANVPKIRIVNTKDFSDIKRELSKHKAFSYYESGQQSINFYYKEPFTIVPFIISFNVIGKSADKYIYQVTSKSKMPFILFDLGGKLKALALISSILTE